MFADARDLCERALRQSGRFELAVDVRVECMQVRVDLLVFTIELKAQDKAVVVFDARLERSFSAFLSEVATQRRKDRSRFASFAS